MTQPSNERSSTVPAQDNRPGTAQQPPTIFLVAPWSLNVPGGVSEVLRNLIVQALRASDTTVVVLFNEWEAGHPVHSRYDGVEHVHLRWVSPWHSARTLRHLLTLPIRLPVAGWKLFRLLQASRPAAVNVHFPDLSALTLLWAYRLACPAGAFILSFHGADLTELETGSAIIRYWWRLLLHSADGITCCSDNLRRRLLEAAGREYDVEVVHNGIDPVRLDAEVERGRLSSRLAGSRYLVSVAKFERKKGLDILLNAFAEVRKTQTELRLAMLGGSGPELEALRRLAGDLGLTDAVEFILDAEHPDALATIRGAVLMVLSSRQEPFGIVLLEAGYFSVPVIATRVGGIPEIIVPGVTGVLIPSEDPHAMAAAILQLLTDPPLQHDLALKARERVTSDFTWHDAFNRYRNKLLARVR